MSTVCLNITNRTKTSLTCKRNATQIHLNGITRSSETTRPRSLTPSASSNKEGQIQETYIRKSYILGRWR